MRRFSFIPVTLIAASALSAQATDTLTLLRPDRVFDGTAAEPHAGWAVLVRGQRIEAVGPVARIAAPGARTIDLPGLTLLPGLIEAHSHVLLHPYNEASWDRQVLNEPQALRVARATVHV